LQLINTRSRNYSCTSSRWWVSTPETCSAAYRNVINWMQSHLFWQLLHFIHDARINEYKRIKVKFQGVGGAVPNFNPVFISSCTKFYFQSITQKKMLKACNISATIYQLSQGCYFVLRFLLRDKNIYLVFWAFALWQDFILTTKASLFSSTLSMFPHSKLILAVYTSSQNVSFSARPSLFG